MVVVVVVVEGLDRVANVALDFLEFAALALVLPDFAADFAAVVVAVVLTGIEVRLGVMMVSLPALFGS